MLTHKGRKILMDQMAQHQRAMMAPAPAAPPK